MKVVLHDGSTVIRSLLGPVLLSEVPLDPLSLSSPLSFIFCTGGPKGYPHRVFQEDRLRPDPTPFVPKILRFKFLRDSRSRDSYSVTLSHGGIYNTESVDWDDGLWS